MFQFIRINFGPINLVYFFVGLASRESGRLGRCRSRCARSGMIDLWALTQSLSSLCRLLWRCIGLQLVFPLEELASFGVISAEWTSVECSARSALQEDRWRVKLTFLGSWYLVLQPAVCIVYHDPAVPSVTTRKLDHLHLARTVHFTPPLSSISVAVDVEGGRIWTLVGAVLVLVAIASLRRLCRTLVAELQESYQDDACRDLRQRGSGTGYNATTRVNALVGIDYRLSER